MDGAVSLAVTERPRVGLATLRSCERCARRAVQNMHTTTYPVDTRQAFATSLSQTQLFVPLSGSEHRRNAVPLFHFKLIDPSTVTDFGFRELPDDAAARTEATALARSVRETRPQLRGSRYSIWVTSDDGAGVCLIPLDATSSP